jgi:hypothetical protein
MSELLADVRDRRARLEKQRRIGVAQIVDPNLPELGILEQPLEHVPDVPLLQCLALQ